MSSPYSRSLPSPQPRPALLGGSETTGVSLDGQWLFTPSLPENDPEKSATDGWRPIQVPGEWTMQGYTVEGPRFAGYFRTFELPAGWEGLDVRLRFDAVHSEARVWVNGLLVGEYEGLCEVFEFDVTGALQPGGNRILVAVRGRTLSDALAFASEYASHDLGGISRKVTLYAVPKRRLTNAFFRTSRSGTNWTIIFSGECSAAMEYELSLSSKDLGNVLLSPARLSLPEGAFEATLEAPGIRPWDSEHPNLYELRLRAADGTAEYAFKIGFREIAVVGEELHVNGRPVKLRGVNRHEVHPLRGRAGCADLARADVEIFRRGNVNFIRTCHYPPPEEFLDACDELGMYVESEAALCWVGDVGRKPWGQEKAGDPKYADHHVRPNAANVLAHRNHPCILLWSLGNESAWNGNFRAAQDVVKALDPTRPTIFHNIREHGGADIMNWHYPMHNDSLPHRDLLNGRGRPLLIGEDLHVQTYNRREVATDPGVRDEWGRCIKNVFEEVWTSRHVLGIAIWSGIDDMFMLPDGRGVGYGPWGVIDSWRREKPEFWHMRKAYSPVRLDLAPLPLPDGNGLVRIRVENRFDFTDLGELRFEWRVGSAAGHAKPCAVPPRHQGTLEIKLPIDLTSEAAVLEIRIFRNERLVDEEKLSFQQPVAKNPAPGILRSGEYRAEDLAGPRVFSTGDWKVLIDPAAQKMEVLCSGEPLLLGLPEVMLLPLDDLRNTTNDFRFDVPPLNHCAVVQSWRSSQVETSPGLLRFFLQLDWDVCTGSLAVTLDKDGNLEVGADLTMTQPFSPRQEGIVFSLPPSFTKIAWQRKGLWSSYPEDHIGRCQGEAVSTGAPTSWASQPAHAWRLDSSPMGSNDFRATRTQVDSFVLSGDGRRFRVEGRGRRAVRAWCDPDATRLLVADYSTGGNETFSRAFYRDERLFRRPGDRIPLTAEGVFL